jgi:hypothetical protein
LPLANLPDDWSVAAMPRQVQVFIPSATEYNRANAQVLRYLTSNPNVHSCSKFSGDKQNLYVFRANDKKVGSIIDDLDRMGVGSQFGVIGSFCAAILLLMFTHCYLLRIYTNSH